MASSFTVDSLNKLSTRLQVALSASCVGILILSCLYFPFWYVILGCTAIALGYFILKNPSLLLYTLIITILLTKIVEKSNTETEGLGIVDIVAGLMVTAALGYVIYNSLVTKKIIVFHPALSFISIASILGLVIGFCSILLNTSTTVNFWYREFSIFASLIAVPLIFREAARSSPKFEKQFFKVLVIQWFIVQTTAILRVQSTMSSATYLYQAPHVRVGIINTAMMAFVFFALLSIEKKRKNLIWYTLAIIYSFIGLLCTFERTIWIAGSFFTPLLLLWFTGNARRQAFRVVRRIFFFFLGIAIIFYFTVPLFSIVVQYLFGHFASSSHVGTDPSLVGRYIEWRYVLRQIIDQPILGVGFGREYKLYAWLSGVTLMSGYTHNTYLGLLLKTGIVGLLLTMTTYIWFILTGQKLSRDLILSEQERLLIKAGTVLLLLCLAHFMVGNMFNDRHNLLNIGLVWGYILVKYEKTKTQHVNDKY